MNTWWGWWTNLDIEIVCNHAPDEPYHYIQISEVDEKGSYYTCPECGQLYKVELKVTPMLTTKEEQTS